MHLPVLLLVLGSVCNINTTRKIIKTAPSPVCVSAYPCFMPALPNSTTFQAMMAAAKEPNDDDDDAVGRSSSRRRSSFGGVGSVSVAAVVKGTLALNPGVVPHCSERFVLSGCCVEGNRLSRASERVRVRVSPRPRVCCTFGALYW